MVPLLLCLLVGMWVRDLFMALFAELTLSSARKAGQVNVLVVGPPKMIRAVRRTMAGRYSSHPYAA